MFKRLKEKLKRKWKEFLKQGRVPTTDKLVPDEMKNNMESTME